MQDIPTVPSTPFQGGFYVARIRIADAVHALIAAPKAEGEFEDRPWGEYGKGIAGARSFFDGQANTLAMAEAGSQLAQDVLQLSIGGFTDWYLPSRDELELLYRHLKPGTAANWPYRGDNPSSVPVGYAYSEEAPAQTVAQAFREGGTEAMDVGGWYWSSTQYSPVSAWYQAFSDGNPLTGVKS